MWVHGCAVGASHGDHQNDVENGYTLFVAMLLSTKYESSSVGYRNK